MNGKKKIDFNFIESLQDKTINLVDIEDIPLYENLVKLRRDLSYKFEIPSFFICNDFTLREIVNKKAVTKEEFLSIKGIGNDFIEKWYEYFESKLNNG